ncbi:MAG TPA: acetyl/propionyl/methylcrotonyl-CoA carboxylase subunit alpha [Casimicrobiaceae bacterium]|nr:acetyl/propionyl/methylcrotonyl-CoA carboxylase subunit alpha [Casimicrobiaceae bacterium]
MFTKILIANRGEIACRVARTARRMDVRTVAVYSDADAGALHVESCDEAYRLGPAPPRDSYLSGDKIIAIALRAGAQAIHPGYGFLSENAEFAAAVGAAGLVFIGPPPAAIRAMGSKAESKTIMGRAGVALVPGYHGADQDDALLRREADAIGYPVLIKASAGGGGKGMRVVERSEDFAAALGSARREAKASFGDQEVLLEKYLLEPRHIEMQVFADTHGECIHLFERDCSVQRRHQKVVEEAPAPGMSAARRAEMGAAAVAAAKAIGYVGAGTVEFIVETAGGGAFYFMEMNTRLQVEHPVTEMITGLDLVEWQLRVAGGERLPRRQHEVAITGHAIEARIYAEDPDRGFLPSTGRISHLSSPPPSEHVRIDSGVRSGDEISRFYDPMLAKLVVSGADRHEALRRLGRALAQYRVVGVATNVAFLRRLIAHPAFAEARLDTGLIARYQADLFPPATAPSAATFAVAALGEISRWREAAATAAALSPDPYAPWHAIEGWWLNSDDHPITLTYAFGDDEYDVDVRVAKAAGSWIVAALGKSMSASVSGADGSTAVVIDGVHMAVQVVPLGDERHVFCGGEEHRLRLVDPLAHAGEEPRQGGHLTAPMSGAIVAVLVKAGDTVARGAPLLILEAMKMEHTIVAPTAGTVSAIHYRQGDQVPEGADLIDVEAAAEET